MILVDVDEHDRTRAHIEKLRRALGRSANQVRTLKKQVADAEQAQRDTFVSVCKELRKLSRKVWALEDERCAEALEAFDTALTKLEVVRADNAGEDKDNE